MESMKSISCKLTMPQLQNRSATVIAELKALLLSRDASSNGFAYSFNASDDIPDRLTAFIRAEKICCGLLTFQLTVKENEVKLAHHQPGSTKEFLEE